MSSADLVQDSISTFPVDDPGANHGVRSIPFSVAAAAIKCHHYSGRTAHTQFSFGLFGADGEMEAVVTFGTPSSPQVARSLLPTRREIVLELNRLAVVRPSPNCASRLVGPALRLLPVPVVVVSYADRGQGHVGYVYQATNFLFAGESRPHDSEYLIDGKRVHPRTLAARGITAPREWARTNGIKFVPIEPKFRYVWIRGRNRKETVELRTTIKWPIGLPYPKGDLLRRNVVNEVA